MEKLFGTDGIRGVANRFPMTPEIMVKIGRAVGSIVEDSSKGIVIGRDSRLSGQMLEHALSAGIVASGVDVWLAGMIPTPAVAFLTHHRNAQAGIVISASHNPAKDNGVKVFAGDGFKLPDELEDYIEELVLNDRANLKQPTGGGLGHVRNLLEADAQYADHIMSSIFPGEIPGFDGIKIVVDCANGAASAIAPSVLKSLHADVIELCVEPDGLNINDGCGALHTEQLRERVRQEGADLGIAFDGDADRLMLVDERGDQIDGDRILAILALDLLQKERLKNKTVVATVMSNLGLEIAMREAGVQLVRAAVGDRHVMTEMRRIGANLGGEQSGHMIMLDHSTTGDGLLTALAVLKILHATEKPLSELANCIDTFPQTLVNVPVKARTPIEEMIGVTEAIRRAEKELGERGRVFVRYSGTELLARVMVEAEDDATVSRIADAIAEEFHRDNR